VLGWLGILAGAVLLAPGASAAGSVTVQIRDLTPPVVSVDQGGSVTFTNAIQDKTLSVGVGPLAVTATVHTDVALTLPSGAHPMQPGQSVTEKFAQSCATCMITYTYRADGANLTQVLNLLPALPAPTPFVVNTLVPLPNLPSVNVPSPPSVNVPLPSLPGAPAPGTPVPGTPVPGTTQTTTTQTTQTTPQSIGGTQYTYNTGAGAPQMAPVDSAAAAAFDPARLASSGSGSAGSSGRGTGSGSGGVAGTYDGASVPVFGQLAGLDNAALDQDSAQTVADPAAGSGGATLPIPALAAVVAMAAVTAALVRTQQAHRAGE
jgi:hypothetical protein